MVKIDETTRDYMITREIKATNGFYKIKYKQKTLLLTKPFFNYLMFMTSKKAGLQEFFFHSGAS